MIEIKDVQSQTKRQTPKLQPKVVLFAAVEIKAALGPAEQELSALISAESRRRSGALCEQILAVSEMVGDPDLLVCTEFNTIIRNSREVHDGALTPDRLLWAG